MENLAVERKFVISSSPHVRSPETVQKIMIDVLIALVPAVVAAAVFFREEAIIPIIISLVAAMGTEFVLVRKGGFFSDGSAAVTGVLLALCLPPGVAWWICVIGSATAIILGKYIFGGLGSNTFNPALVGRAILLASWGGRMTEWLGPIDLRSTATPLADPGYGTPLMDLFTGNVAGSLGETSAIALLIGGAYLMYKKHINWRIPGTYIISAFILGTLFILFSFGYTILDTAPAPIANIVCFSAIIYILYIHSYSFLLYPTFSKLAIIFLLSVTYTSRLQSA